MSDKLKRIGNALTGLAALATFHSYYLSLQDQSMKNLIETFRNEKESLGRTISKLAQDNAISEARKLDYLKKAEIEMTRLQEILDRIKQSNNEGSIIDLIKKNNVDWSRDADEIIVELKNLMDNYKGSGSSSQFIDNFNLNFWDEIRQAGESYLDWVNTLSVLKQGALAHILASITILLSLSSLITVYYSDYLIKRFNLETNFPRLAKYINLRRKFQQYYFFINTVIIIIFLFIIIFMNIYVFIIS